MKRGKLCVVCCFLAVSGSLWGVGERTLRLGAAYGWTTAEKRVQVGEYPAIRPYPVLALSTAWTGDSQTSNDAEPSRPGVRDDVAALYAAIRSYPAAENALDLALSFDEAAPQAFADSTGRYRVSTAGTVLAAAERWARYGRGAAAFAGGESSTAGETGIRVVPTAADALFSPGRNARDFSIEFWLYPHTLENGELIVEWSSILGRASGNIQRIYCETVKSRLRWTFQDFFADPRNHTLSISIEGRDVLIPKKWSHHLIRYSAGTGLLEYLVNGRVENSAHLTGYGREGGDVFTPNTGRDGAFLLGNRFSGMLDEFRVYKRWIEAPGRTALDNLSRTALALPELTKYPRSGGRIETQTLDLGEPGSRVLKIEASGGRFSPGTERGGKSPSRNMYAGTGNFRFSDDSACQFYLKSSEEPYRFASIPWMPINTGQNLSGFAGRYIQLAVAFYPSGDCSTTPYLEEVRVIYESNEPPYPPALVIAEGRDGAVELSWRVSPDTDTSGYLVYYGTRSGVYYGDGAILGESPINAGNRTSLRIEGLKNGTLYFFAVAAYDGTGSGNLHPGKFSREVSARPLRISE